MHRLVLHFLTAVATFAISTTGTIGWRIVQAIYQEPVDVPTVKVQNVTTTYPLSMRWDGHAQIFSGKDYWWYAWSSREQKYVRVHITGPNNPCELAGEIGYIVDAEVVRLCREWDGEGNVFEWLDAHRKPKAR